MRRAALVVGLLVASVLAGGAIAMAPHNEEEPCVVAPLGWPVPAGAEGWSGGARMTLWPPGVRCDYTAGPQERSEFVGPTKGETVAVIALTLLVLAAAAARPGTPPARGATVAVAFLAAFSFFMAFGGAFTGAMMGSFLVWALAFTVVLGLTQSATTALTLTILLPTIVFFAWAVPWFMGQGHVAIVVGIAAGALGAAAIDRTRRLGHRLSAARKLAPTSPRA